MEQRKFAKNLRSNMTDAEHLLWRHLRAKRIEGAKFRRQHPIGPYVVDFVELKHQIIVEADGGQHNGCDNDSERDDWLTRKGFRVLRFWNHDILGQTDVVLEEIYRALRASPSPRPSPSRGEGVQGASNGGGRQP
ncbi:endonuclease domain-containing protein [Marinobacter sp. M1N3S26]|uniref:endonuclease domain-containing protein n=1 Tax=unclassified Marinobacter TaxID=83889 RepID=UPI00387B1C0B